MKLGSTYLIVKDFDQSLKFYEQLFERKADSMNQTRWAEFHLDGGCLALYNPRFDEELINAEAGQEIHLTKEYIAFKSESSVRYGNNVVLNLWVSNLEESYSRVNEQKIGKTTNIIQLSKNQSYGFFMVTDPDGNMVEIAGDYKV